MPSRCPTVIRPLVLIAALVLAVPSVFQGVSAQNVAAPATEQETMPLKNDASHQGIRVHGHWKIVVKNPDGSVAETREFENSYTGGSVLSVFIIGGYSSGGLLINLSSSGTSICNKLNCAIVPSATTGVGGASLECGNTQNVTCAANLTTSNGTPTVLAGQFTATQTGTITTVGTAIGTCPGSMSSNTCAASTSGVTAYGFTSTSIAPVSVNAGQVVQVSVTISFS